MREGRLASGLPYTHTRKANPAFVSPPTPSLSLDIVGKEGEGGGHMLSCMMFSVARYGDFPPGFKELTLALLTSAWIWGI